MSHTPGPWVVRQPEDDELAEVYAENGGDQLCFICEKNPQSAANSHLIAAAPELLAALKDLLDQMHGIGLPEWHGAEGLCFDRANAAVASAEGRVE